MSTTERKERERARRHELIIATARDRAEEQGGHSRPLRAVFEAILRVLSPFADGRDPELLAEVGWSSIHGLVTLARDGRLPPADRDRRLALLTEQLAAPTGAAHGRAREPRLSEQPPGTPLG